MAFYTYTQQPPVAINATDIDNRLNEADNKEHRIPFNDGDVIYIPVPEKLGTVDWTCTDANGNPASDRRNNGSFLVLLGCKFASGEPIDSIALSLFRTKPAFVPAADGSRPMVNGVAPRNAKPSAIWNAIKALPTKGTGSNKHHEVRFKTLEYEGSDGRYHVISAFQPA